jgi:hypothetical protein
MLALGTQTLSMGIHKGKKWEWKTEASVGGKGCGLHSQGGWFVVGRPHTAANLAAASNFQRRRVPAV